MTKIAKIDPKEKLALAKREAEDAVFAEIDNQQEIEISENFKAEAFMAVGMLAAVPAIIKSITASLTSKRVLALREFQERKLYKALGHDNFADFLTNSPHSPMSKSQYFDRLNLLLKEGEETYDLLNELGISNKDRKRLPPDSVRVVGDEILVNNHAVQIGNNSEVKAVVNDLIRNWQSAEAESKKAAAEKEATDKQVESLREQLKVGAAEHDELRRAVDASAEGTTYERALTRGIGALIKLAMEANNLSLIETQRRGAGDLAALWQQMILVRDALQQPDFRFQVDAPNDGVSDLAKRVFAEDDDFGDENEQ